MLPYYWPEPAREEDPAEPPYRCRRLRVAPYNNGIKLGASLDKFVATKLNTFSTCGRSEGHLQTGLMDKTFPCLGLWLQLHDKVDGVTWQLMSHIPI